MEFVQCHICTKQAVCYAPQSVDQGKTLNWLPVCVPHADGWWDGRDWGPIKFVSVAQWTERPSTERKAVSSTLTRHATEDFPGFRQYACGECGGWIGKGEWNTRHTRQQDGVECHHYCCQQCRVQRVDHSVIDESFED